MPDRLTGIEVFVASVRKGSITAAARALSMSPAMATKHLDALEQRVGAKLVHRTTRRLTLTEAGIKFLNKAEALLSGLDEAEREAGALGTDISGRLRVACPVAFGTRHVVPLITEFTRLHPRVHVELGLSDGRVDLLEERWDVAIRVGVVGTDDVVARKVAAVTTVVAASPAYLQRAGTPTFVSDLSHHDCLGYTLSEHLGPTGWRFGSEGHVNVSISGPISADNGEALVGAAISGAGIVYAPRFLVSEPLREGRLVALSLDKPTLAIGAVYLVTHPSRRSLTKTRYIMEHIARGLAANASEF